MMKKLLYSFILLVMTGCSHGGVKLVKGDVIADTLQFDSLTLSTELLQPTRMIVSCGKVVVYQFQGEDVFTVIDINDHGKCEVIGRRGRGPEEFISVDVQSLKPTDDGLKCLDVGGKVKHIHLGQDHRTETEMIIPTSGSCQNGILLDDRFISQNVLNFETEYALFDNINDGPQFHSEDPGWTTDLGQPLPFRYMKNMVAHPTADLFASFYVFFRRVRILDGNCNVISDIDVQVPDEFPVYSSEIGEQHYAYASYPCSTLTHIYAACFNVDTKSLSSAIPEIQVWNWSGELERRLIPDRHFDIFAVDEEHGILYAMDSTRGNVLYYQHIDLVKN